MISSKEYINTQNLLRQYKLNYEDTTKTKLSNKYRQAQAHIDHMTVYLLSKHYNEKIHLHYYDEDTKPLEVQFIAFNKELPSDPLRIL